MFSRKFKVFLFYAFEFLVFLEERVVVLREHLFVILDSYDLVILFIKLFFELFNLRVKKTFLSFYFLFFLLELV